MKPKIPATLVLIATLAFVLSPLLSTGFSGFTANQFPVPQVNPPVQPAGYAFSIWGVIYLWLVVSAGFGLWRAAGHPDWQTMRMPLLLSLFIGSFWIAAANSSPILATGMIVVMAVAAIVAMLRAGEADPWLLARPIALYAGWLTAATGVAFGVTLGGYAILQAQTAALICLVAVLAVALVVQAMRPREWGYPLAIIWALVGVIVTNLATANVPVIALALFGIAALVFRAVQAQR